MSSQKGGADTWSRASHPGYEEKKKELWHSNRSNARGNPEHEVKCHVCETVVWWQYSHVKHVACKLCHLPLFDHPDEHGRQYIGKCQKCWGWWICEHCMYQEERAAVRKAEEASTPSETIYYVGKHSQKDWDRYPDGGGSSWKGR